MADQARQVGSDHGLELRPVQPSRKKLRPGDIFVMRAATGQHLYGRVVAVDLPEDRAPLPGCNMIYVYDILREAAEPVPIAELTPDRLLIPPMFINRLGWSRGYMQTVAHTDLTAEDLLEQHCFVDYLRRGYVDEKGKQLPARTDPCGEWGLASYLVLSDYVHKALRGEQPVADI
ncbi:immunity 26/phosphotriesterase HocA family protein [Dactylosporangium vinaceum]|uniref:Imm26 family immunity protein n=1 Tax=Dactylosporangium vinaceum TaxID=53362 RepID=A0ABV5M1C5_9ACTN|nr:Imm26 family immunity protein [Dactylosporangium vinaceum]UAB99573.1 immunity 26/phosphotriesterase HocA family protein [Dactylosporangium vinaceum]